MEKIGNNWDNIFKELENNKKFNSFLKLIEEKYQTSTCYPSYENIFKAFKLTSYEDVKVVILGQDPYHTPNQAMGLSFSVPTELLQPSLKAIFKELNEDLNVDIPKNGDLTKWAKEGVFLLNSILTVEKNKPASHAKLGWESFTNYVIKKLNERKEPIVFVLWGNFARSKKEFITNPKHLIIESPHPSPFSAHKGFYGSKPFSKTNKFLKNKGLKEVNWDLKD